MNLGQRAWHPAPGRGDLDAATQRRGGGHRRRSHRRQHRVLPRPARPPQCGPAGARRPGLRGHEQSGGGGGIRQQFSSAVNIRLSQISLKVFEHFEEEFGASPDFHQYGYLFLASTPQEAAELRQECELQRSLGVPVRLVYPEPAEGRLRMTFKASHVASLRCRPDLITWGYEKEHSVALGGVDGEGTVGETVMPEAQALNVRLEGGQVPRHYRQGVNSVHALPQKPGHGALGIGGTAELDAALAPVVAEQQAGPLVGQRGPGVEALVARQTDQGLPATGHAVQVSHGQGNLPDASHGPGSRRRRLLPARQPQAHAQPGLGRDPGLVGIAGVGHSLG
ncbi:MAG: FAD-binding oxidoreductase [Dehalococcoidia bacterium]|nr:FAD-binding oxidoreductase [Dehalococcoidia bacterium]